MRPESVVSYIAGQPWAVTEERWSALEAAVAAAMQGEGLTEAELRARLAAYQDDEPPRPQAASRQGSIAVIPICGDIVPRASVFAEWLGIVTSCARLVTTVRQFAADPNVGTILLDIHSGGGSVYGVHEVHAELRKASAGGTRVVSQVNAFAGSGGYWLATGGEEVVCIPSGECGGIGVFAVHMDVSEALAKAGVKATVVKAGRFKAEGDPRVPLTKEALEALQERANEYYALFVGDVAAGRGTTPAKVRAGFGQGRMLGARQAKVEGMVDRIATMPETLERLLGRKRNQVGGGAAATVLEPEPEAATDVEDPPPPPVPPVEEPPAEQPTAAAATTNAEIEIRRRALDLV